MTDVASEPAWGQTTMRWRRCSSQSTNRSTFARWRHFTSCVASVAVRGAHFFIFRREEERRLGIVTEGIEGFTMASHFDQGDTLPLADECTLALLVILLGLQNMSHKHDNWGLDGRSRLVIVDVNVGDTVCGSVNSLDRFVESINNLRSRLTFTDSGHLSNDDVRTLRDRRTWSGSGSSWLSTRAKFHRLLTDVVRTTSTFLLDRRQCPELHESFQELYLFDRQLLSYRDDVLARADRLFEWLTAIDVESTRRSDRIQIRSRARADSA